MSTSKASQQSRAQRKKPDVPTGHQHVCYFCRTISNQGARILPQKGRPYWVCRECYYKLFIGGDPLA